MPSDQGDDLIGRVMANEVKRRQRKGEHEVHARWQSRQYSGLSEEKKLAFRANVKLNKAKQIMAYAERFKRFKDATGISFLVLAELFGVDDIQTVKGWYYRGAEMSHEFRGTLLRLEGDDLPALSPSLSKSTVEAFNRGRARAKLLKESPKQQSAR